MGEGTFGELLRSLRDTARLTQEELARLAQLSTRSVSELERGKVARPRRATVSLLADALGLSGADRARFQNAAAADEPSPATGEDADGVVDTLDRDPPFLVGRDAELAALVRSPAPRDPRRPPPVRAVHGMPGVGKTALAVRAAHTLAPAFPDGRYHLDLHGHAPHRPPLTPGEALGALLVQSGVAPRHLPPDDAARAALWRARLAGRRVLVLLDDALRGDQVLPLLPSGPGTLVVVTSRHRLSALGAAVVELRPLALADATRLLGTLAPRRTGAVALRSAAQLTGRVPLAVALVAGLLESRPDVPLERVVDDLRRAREESRDAADGAVAAAFTASWARLATDRRVVLRGLSLLPGETFGVAAVAALTGLPEPSARRALGGLREQRLVEEREPGRYAFHDLVRGHARTAARARPGGTDATARRRLLEHYRAGCARTAAAGGAERAEALRWFRAELPNAAAAVQDAAARRAWSEALPPARALAAVLRSEGPWDAGLHAAAVAERAARELGDGVALAEALLATGRFRRLRGEHAPAAEALRAALALAGQLADPAAQGAALVELGVLHHRAGAHREAAEAGARAREAFRAAGDRHAEAEALLHLGIVQRASGRPTAAESSLRTALAGFRAAGDQAGEADALRHLGAVHACLDDHRAARRELRAALRLQERLGDPHALAHARTALGAWLCRFGAPGDLPAAEDALRRAVAGHRLTGDRHGEAIATSHLGLVRVRAGHREEGEAALHRGAAALRAARDPLGLGHALVHLAVALRLGGDTAAADVALDEAHAAFGAVGDERGVAALLNARGDVRRAQGRPVDALGCHRRAAEVARAAGSRTEEARALEGEGRALLAAGEERAGRKRLREAAVVLAALGLDGATDPFPGEHPKP